MRVREQDEQESTKEMILMTLQEIEHTIQKQEHINTRERP